MPYVLQTSITTNQRTFQTFQEHHPGCGTRLTTPAHRLVSLRFFEES